MRESKRLTTFHWWIGDWLAYGEHAYGTKYAQAVEVLNHQYSEGSLRNMMWVSNNVALSLRSDKLGWDHHRQVSALDPSDQEEVLTLAVENNWSTRDTREEVKRRKAELPHRARGTGEEVDMNHHHRSASMNSPQIARVLQPKYAKSDRPKDYDRKCQAKGCKQAATWRGFCIAHWRDGRRGGDR